MASVSTPVVDVTREPTVPMARMKEDVVSITLNNSYLSCISTKCLQFIANHFAQFQLPISIIPGLEIKILSRELNYIF